ncbi:MAG: ribosome recycling factor [Phycisphaerae bacterium]
MLTKQIVTDNENKMKKAIEHLHDELKGLRTGRASTGLVENIRVDYYGNPTAMKQLATLAAPAADMIVIKPFDAGSLKDIEKAIKNSDLSIAPVIDGKVIRLNIPPLSEERRRQLVNQAKQAGEQSKVTIRNIRRDAIKHLEQQEKAKAITEDDLEKGKKQIDDMTKEYTEKIDQTIKAKSDEIMQE